MKARIVRLEQASQGALGYLLIDGAMFCCTLEPDASETGKLHIPPGEYRCVRFHGTKWPDTFEIIVAGHSAVLFHAGNTETDTLGCVLLGSLPGKLRGARAVLNSGATFRKFLDRTWSMKEFMLLIEDRY